MFPAETGASVERRPGDGLAVLLNELATGLLVGGCLRDDLLNAEDSKPLNSDLFFTGAGAGNVPEEKRSEWIPMASRVNRAEELMAVLGDGRGPEPTLRLGAMPSPDPPNDPCRQRTVPDVVHRCVLRRPMEPESNCAIAR